MLLEEKIEGRKVQFLPFLLSRNMRNYTLKNTGFCPNEVIHFNCSRQFESEKVDHYAPQVGLVSLPKAWFHLLQM